MLAAPTHILRFSLTSILIGCCVVCFAGPPETPPLLLLRNGNVLCGNCEVVGAQIIVRRDDGSQLRLRRDEVAHIAASYEQLYQHRASQQTFRDATVYATDFAWCLRNGLIDGAQSELAKLKQFDPENPQIARLQRQLDTARTPHANPRVATNQAFSQPQPAMALIEIPDGVPPTSVATFATRVQPMLINRCANAGCHRTGSDSKWQLSHLGVNVRVSSQMTQRNLAATAGHIDFNDPMTSELLRYAITPHAGGAYDVTGRTATSAEATLRAWLSQLGAYPQPHINRGAAIESGSFPVPLTSNIAPVSFEAGDDNSILMPAGAAQSPPEGFWVDESGELVYDPDGKHRVTVKATAIPAKPTSRPSRLPAVENPFSADLFNRQQGRP